MIPLFQYSEGALMRLMRTPKKIDIDITNRCNLRCRYCYHFESPGDAGTISRPESGSGSSRN